MFIVQQTDHCEQSGIDNAKNDLNFSLNLTNKNISNMAPIKAEKNVAIP